VEEAPVGLAVLAEAALAAVEARATGEPIPNCGIPTEMNQD
jgi:hypothetical protein